MVLNLWQLDSLHESTASTNTDGFSESIKTELHTFESRIYTLVLGRYGIVTNHNDTLVYFTYREIGLYCITPALDWFLAESTNSASLTSQCIC